MDAVSEFGGGSRQWPNALVMSAQHGTKQYCMALQVGRNDKLAKRFKHQELVNVIPHEFSEKWQTHLVRQHGIFEFRSSGNTEHHEDRTVENHQKDSVNESKDHLTTSLSYRSKNCTKSTGAQEFSGSTEVHRRCVTNKNRYRQF